MDGGSGGKTLSLWIQALQIWRLNRKSEGLDQKLPKKGTPEHSHVLSIMQSLKSGDAMVDPDVIKTVSKPRIMKPKAVTKPKLEVHASTFRTGKATARGKAVKKVRADIESKHAERDLKNIEDELKKSRDKFEKEVDATQKAMVRLLVKLESGKTLSPEEAREVAEQLANLKLTISQKEEKIKLQEEVAKRKREAHRDQLEKDEAARAKEKVRVAEETEAAATAVKKTYGLARNLTKNEKDNIKQFNKIVKEGIGASPGDISTPWREGMKKLLDDGALFPVPDPDSARAIAGAIGVTRDSFPVIEGSKWYFSTAPNNFINIKVGVKGATDAGERLEPVEKLAEVVVEGTVDPAAVPLSSVAPIVESLTSVSGTADPKDITPVVKEIVEKIESAADPPETVGSGLRLSVEPMLLPGSRDSAPCFAHKMHGKGLGGQCGFSSSILAGMLYPGSRNNHPDFIGGGESSAPTINPSSRPTNRTAIRLAEELKVEIDRLNDLAAAGIPVLVNNPGQSTH